MDLGWVHKRRLDLDNRVLKRLSLGRLALGTAHACESNVVALFFCRASLVSTLCIEHFLNLASELTLKHGEGVVGVFFQILSQL